MHDVSVMQAKLAIAATFEEELAELLANEEVSAKELQARVHTLALEYTAITDVAVADPYKLRPAEQCVDLRSAFVDVVDGTDGQPLGFVALLRYAL